MNTYDKNNIDKNVAYHKKVISLLKKLITGFVGDAW